MKPKLVPIIICGLLSAFLVLRAVNNQHAWAAEAANAVAYTGGEKCAPCHPEVVSGFKHNIHAKSGHYGVNLSCESCHGQADAHIQTGDPARITNPAKIEAERAAGICFECHSRDARLTYWRGSAHNTKNIACPTCHQVHDGLGREHLLKAGLERELCLNCHQEVRSALFKRSKHPMRDSSSPTAEGKMECSSCHNPHGTQTRDLIEARSVNDKCYECHFEMRAPVLWEHSPVKENCLVCHAPHGSNNDKLLVTMVPRLCQQCHLQGRHQSGALPVNSAFLFNRGCLNCHPMVHGSNNPSGPVLQR